MLFKDLLVYKRKRLYKVAKHRKDDLKNQPYDYTGNNGLLPNQLSRHIQRNQTMREFIFLLNDLTPEQLAGLSVEDLSSFLHEQLRNAYDLKESQIEQKRPGLMREAERFFVLQQIDTLWREHLQAMDALRESVGLRGYGQKDPLIEYKNEGYDMFLDMMTNVRRNVIYSMFMFEPSRPDSN